MTRIAVVGATGLLGSHLVEVLRDRGDDVVAVSRTAAQVAGAPTVAWEPARSPLPDEARDGVDAIVVLAGTPIAAGRWTDERRAAILSSRVGTTRAVAAAFGSVGPRVLVSASAVGYYGSTDDPVDERSAPGDDFLAQVCVAWEREALAVEHLARVVVARSGVVLASDGGAYPRLRRAARLGVLGAMGSGRQWVPWIHLTDEIAALVHCVDRDDVRGAVNLVAPTPVRQSEFARELRRRLHRPSAPPAPAPLVRAVLGPASDLVLTGQRAVPKVLDATGFSFRYPTVPEAFDALG